MYHYSIALADQSAPTYGITNWEVKDGFFGADLREMSPAQVEDARDFLIKKMCRVVLYAVSTPVTDYAAYVRIFRYAHLLCIENIQLSWKALEGAEDEAIRRIIAMGASFSIGVVFELDAEHMDEFGFARYGALRNENTGLVFNSLEFVKAGISPYNKILSKTKFAPDIRFFRVCDIRSGDKVPVALRKGNAEVKESASKLLTRTYCGYFSFLDYGSGEPLPKIMESFAQLLCQM